MPPLSTPATGISIRTALKPRNRNKAKTKDKFKAKAKVNHIHKNAAQIRNRPSPNPNRRPPATGTNFPFQRPTNPIRPSTTWPWDMPCGPPSFDQTSTASLMPPVAMETIPLFWPRFCLAMAKAMLTIAIVISITRKCLFPSSCAWTSNPEPASEREWPFGRSYPRQFESSRKTTKQKPKTKKRKETTAVIGLFGFCRHLTKSCPGRPMIPRWD